VSANSTRISAYPNPSNGTFVIEGTVNNSNSAEIEVLNIIGQVVYHETMPVQSNTIKKQIFLSNENVNGIYQVRIKTDNTTNVVRVVIER